MRALKSYPARPLNPFWASSIMEKFIFAFFAFLIIVALMSVGVVFAGKQMHGSCGKNRKDGGECICTDEEKAQKKLSGECTS